MRNTQLGARTVSDIDGQVAKILRGLGNPEPPLDLLTVRELLKLDRDYYSTTDDGLLREAVSRMKVAGFQIIKRPTLLVEAVRKFSLKALYIPDQKRILLDKDLPEKKHRWNEAHEIGHDIIPWHKEMMLGDTEQTLVPACHEAIEAEANYAAGQLLFLARRFPTEARSLQPSIESVREMSKRHGNTITSTLWRYVEQASPEKPMVAMITCHPHPALRDSEFDPASPCKYFIRSPAFVERFGNSASEVALFREVVGYSRPQKGGKIGVGEVALTDEDGNRHLFFFETFFNRYEALTLGVWLRQISLSIAF